MRYRNGTGLFLENRLNPSYGKKLFQWKILHLNIYTLFIGLIL